LACRRPRPGPELGQPIWRGPAAARQGADLASLLTYRSGLARTVAYARSRPEIFRASRPGEVRLLNAVERAAAIGAWKSLLDFTLALESLEAFYSDFSKLKDNGARARSFHVASGAFLAAYRFALEFIELAEGDPKLALILNDPVGPNLRRRARPPVPF
jgi:hypothetical protein